MNVRKDLSRGELFRENSITKDEFATLVVSGEMKEFSDEWALNASFLEKAEVYKEIADFIGHVEGDAAVELGCGSGELMRAIRSWNPNMSLIGMDMNPHLLEVAEERVTGEKVRRYSGFEFENMDGVGIIMCPTSGRQSPVYEEGGTTLFIDDIRYMVPTTRAISSGMVPMLFTLMFPSPSSHLELEHEWYNPHDEAVVTKAMDTMYVSAMRKVADMMPSGGKLVLGKIFSAGSDEIVKVFEKMNEDFCDSRYRVEDIRDLSMDRINGYRELYGKRGKHFSRIMPSFGEGEYFVLVKLERK